MATKWGDKDPADQVNYGFNWTAELAKLVDPSATIATSAWTVLGEATTPALAVISDGISADAKSTNVRLGGGTAGTYEVQNRVTLSTGEILDRKTKLKVKDR